MPAWTSLRNYYQHAEIMVFISDLNVTYEAPSSDHVNVLFENYFLFEAIGIQ